ncbi:IS1380 family transposase [Saccharopolyspora hattusasensis]|uniref:IS1380 family transposase n=1 Tax=Saccharopolyspora hattusasensis TaxID=1128679 RepID=UPI003D98C932
MSDVRIATKVRSTFEVQATGWSRGLEVTADGEGIVSHAGLALLRGLTDKTGLTAGLSKALAGTRLLVHNRGRVVADVACAIADGARAISDFRVMGDQRELFGPVASVPTAWRTLEEIADGGTRTAKKITAAVNTARRYAWDQIVTRHGTLPGVRIADKTLEGVTCVRIDATVTDAHSDKEWAEANFKGFGHHPLQAYCDNTGGEPLAWMLRRGSAGSNTAEDHIAITDSAIAALPQQFRRRLMVTVDGAGASHELIAHLDKLASRRGYQLIYSVGWALTEREKTAIRLVPERAWVQAIGPRGQLRERRAEDACDNPRCTHARCWVEQAHVAELTGLLRQGPGGDQLSAWPEKMRVFVRRERPHPGAQLTLFETQDGWRYTLWVTNRPETTKGWLGQSQYIDAAHRVHARVEDCIRTGKDTGLGRFPSRDFAINTAWLTTSMTAAILLSWLKLLALDGALAKAEPKTLRYRILHTAARLVRGGRRRRLKIPRTWPWATQIESAWQRITALPQAP